MVLTNAVYFKGIWKYPFKSQSTHKEFFVSPKQSVEVHMMSQTGNFKYVDSKKFRAQVLEMPFRGDSASMVVLLPRCGRGSKTVEWLVRRLKPKRLAFELKAMRFVPLTVKFPKFSVETTLNDELISTLKKMRMRKLFSSTADLTNFAPDGGLLVNGAIHKALIQVDEGVQTAAATASVLKK
nr:antichymotrypsin-2-like [Penaeus vannamei]